MSFTLVFAFALLLGFVTSQMRQASGFRGSSGGFQALLLLSTVAGMLTAFGLLAYHFMHAAWYDPLVLFVAASVAAAILFGILDSMVGAMLPSFLGFVGWPAAAYWTYTIIAVSGRA